VSRIGQLGEHSFKVRVRFYIIGFGSFDQAVQIGAGFGTLDTGAEQPVLAANRERSDGIFDRVVINRVAPVLKVGDEPYATTKALSKSATEQAEQSRQITAQNKLSALEMRLEFLYRQYDHVDSERLNVVERVNTGGGKAGHGHTLSGEAMSRMDVLSILNRQLEELIANIGIAHYDIQVALGEDLGHRITLT